MLLILLYCLDRDVSNPLRFLQNEFAKKLRNSRKLHSNASIRTAKKYCIHHPDIVYDHKSIPQFFCSLLSQAGLLQFFSGLCRDAKMQRIPSYAVAIKFKYLSHQLQSYPRVYYYCINQN